MSRQRPGVLLLGDTLNLGGSEGHFAEVACGLDRSRWDLRVSCVRAEGPLRARLEAVGLALELDPESVLRSMSQIIKSTGRVLLTFGPPWFHSLGGHLFSVFPWAHLIFTEEALIRWRSRFKHDGATRFEEVEGGLNQITIRRSRGRELIPVRDLPNGVS